MSLRIRVRDAFDTPLAILSVIRKGWPKGGLRPEHWSSIAFWILAAYLLVAFTTFADYGISYDQEWHSIYGRYVLQWYSSLFVDRGALEYHNMFNYGALYDASAEALAKVRQRLPDLSGHGLSGIDVMNGIEQRRTLSVVPETPGAPVTAKLGVETVRASQGRVEGTGKLQLLARGKRVVHGDLGVEAELVFRLQVVAHSAHQRICPWADHRRRGTGRPSGGPGLGAGYRVP